MRYHTLIYGIYCVAIISYIQTKEGVKMSGQKGIIEDKCFNFAICIVKLNAYLQDYKREYVISKQVIKSRTSIGANVSEAVNAESKTDFIHKPGIFRKECAESIFWLKLLIKSNILKENQVLPLLNDTNELLKMIRSSIMTAKKNI